jgi:glycosyltransferase involved in cell wall biosynthesis
MKLSFIIPAYNEELLIGKCLVSILDQVKDQKDIEVIVVNNASTDQTKEIAQSYSGVKVVDEPQKGLVRARQAGFLASNGELLANVDADTILTPGWVEFVLSEFEKDKNLVALSGPFIYYDFSEYYQLLVRGWYMLATMLYWLNYKVFGTGAVLQGGNFTLRREALEKVDGYDTRIEFYGEDTDIAKRISKVGRVRFTFRLPIYTTGRRIKKEGMIKMAVKYSLNYFWVIFFKKPFNKKYVDVRGK